MLTHGRGVLCAPITEERCAELELDMQVSSNTSIYETPFTVTVDLLEGCTTGVSMHDRAMTIRALADPKTNLPTWASGTYQSFACPLSRGTSSCRSYRGKC